MAQWYAHVNGRKFGPVDQEQMQAWVREGRVGGDASVWCDGMDDWKPAREVPELAPAIGPGAAGPAPFNAPPARGTTFANAAYTPAGEPKRPGGLTALAVLNFVFGGLGVIGLATTALQWAGPANPVQTAMADSPLYWVNLLLGALATVLLLVSGVGYLKLKIGAGLLCGNVYAIVSLIAQVLGVALLLGSDFGGSVPAFAAEMAVTFGLIAAAVGAVYPVLTLILLNKVFARHFVN